MVYRHTDIAQHLQLVARGVLRQRLTGNGVAPDVDVDSRRRSGVLHHVRERLLDDPIRGEFYSIGQRSGLTIDRQVDVDSRVLTFDPPHRRIPDVTTVVHVPRDPVGRLLDRRAAAVAERRHVRVHQGVPHDVQPRRPRGGAAPGRDRIRGQARARRPDQLQPRPDHRAGSRRPRAQWRGLRRSDCPAVLEGWMDRHHHRPAHARCPADGSPARRHRLRDQPAGAGCGSYAPGVYFTFGSQKR